MIVRPLTLGLALLVLTVVACDEGADDGGKSEGQLCYPLELSCSDSAVFKCDQSGMAWEQVKYCPYGCLGDDCRDEGSCLPECAGKTCGSDGCGGSCGSCPAGTHCGALGTCEVGSDTGCGSVTSQGECNGNQLKYCNNGQLVIEDCAKCGLDPYTMVIDCLGCPQFESCIDEKVAVLGGATSCGRLGAVLSGFPVCQSQFPCAPLPVGFCVWFGELRFSCMDQGGSGIPPSQASTAEEIQAQCH